MTSAQWIIVLMGLMNVLLGGVLVQIIRNRPALRKIDHEREANLLNERAEEMVSMRERIDRLEAADRAKDKEHTAEVIRLKDEQAAKDELHKAIQALNRHRMNNLNTSFQALLMLLKRGVAVEDAVEEVERMRAEHLEREGEEAAIIRAAAITANLPEPEL